MSRKVLIVGGVAGGASAAARLRRLDEDAQIVLFERGAYISFANCGLPYYIGNTIQERSKLLIQSAEGMKQRFNIDVRTETEVIAIDPVSKTVQVRSKEHGEYVESYEALILSPGARPFRPELPGIDSKHIYSLRNIPDTNRIKQRVTAGGASSAIVIGGGFIGVEMAENLRGLGLQVTLIEGGAQILPPFDMEIAGILAKEMEEQGISLLMEQTVTRFTDLTDGIEVHTSQGNSLRADLVILAIGVAPDTAFLQGSGLELGQRGHILVNERMQTNVAGIYAVGDAVEVTDLVNGSKTAIPLAGPANKQGRIAADHLAGLNSTYPGTQGTSIIKVFGLTGASTGNNEKTLQRLGIPYRTTVIHPLSHAGYYPGATPLSIKLLFGEDGKVLGAQAVGHSGVDKRIDSIATVIHFQGTIRDLTELELAYAPPYSSAKDPVNMAGYTAENILSGRTQTFVPRDLDERDEQATILVDVRSEIEHANGHIPGSLLIPVDDLRERLDELDSSKEIWVYCQVGLRGYTASRILQQKGYRVRNLTGGYKYYQLFAYRPGKLIHSEAAAGAEQVPASQPLTESSPRADLELNACGLSCPGPLIQIKQSMDTLAAGQVLHVTASDPGFYEDVQAWASMSKHRLIQVNRQDNGLIDAFVSKGLPESNNQTDNPQAPRPEGTSMIVFSGDLDKAIASFIIANGAAASGKKVTLFFTFWGLNILRKPANIKVNKGLVGRMFGAMMPRGSRMLPLSRMNMFGLGAKMIRDVMKHNQVSSLEELMDSAMRHGVEIVACQMSMDVMGLHKEELIDGVKIGGVGYYLGKADQSGINLFI
ncbi:FAD-dependent oxidoreductase [Paenibacillus sanguinis]|uniref:FAD-dependent oxidoreductase n=1 Tax=Paenibacillus sanguinis TaxID=225906 RepID=UPI00037C7B58|nr:FAD-dependent oxidoreductase [Paenibacillus sanguinis]